MTANKYHVTSIKLLIVLVLVDFDGDFLLRQEAGLLKLIQDSIRDGIIALLLLVGLLGFYNIFAITRIRFVGLVCLSIISIVFGYGLFYGILANNSDGAMREFIAIAPLGLIPIFLRMKRDELSSIAKYLIYSLVLISAAKILFSQLVHIYTYGYLGWKILLRSSILLLLPYIYFLMKIIKGNGRKRDIILLCIVTIEIFMAQARALNVALLLATLFIMLLSNFNRRVLFSIMAIGISILLAAVFTDVDMENTLGIWSGAHFENGISHREEQLDVLIDRYIDRPLTGFGFGYYTVGYLTYAELANSYLLELDLINFSTKIGIPLSLLYAFSYILFILQYRKIKYLDHGYQIVAFSCLLTLILLLFYSLFQTAHSSMLYWMVYAIGFTFVFARNKCPFRLK